MNCLTFMVSCIVAVSARTGFGPTDQEWGFVTVRQGAHMFWWLHKTTADVGHYTERPLIIWLQGGPGASSTGYGNFAELGPVDADLNVRNFSWDKNYNVLFVDNPVGTGFSHVDVPSNFATTNKQIADDFVALLKGFYEAIPEMKNTPLFIFSESYGGKMAAEIALVLNKVIRDGSLDIQFGGVGLGDAWISPMDSVMTWAPYLLNVGAVDQAGYDEIQKMALETKKAYDEGRHVLATQLWGKTEGVIALVTERIDFYNILTKISTIHKARSNTDGLAKPLMRNLRDSLDDQIHVLMNSEVSKALNLNVTWGDQQHGVFQALKKDFMKPVTEIVELLLNTTDIKVAVYNGQLDLIVDTPGTVKWVDELRFGGSEDWPISPRLPLIVNYTVEGYYKKLGNLAMYWVDRAGHMVPTDNPAAMDYILKDVTQGFFTKNENYVN